MFKKNLWQNHCIIGNKMITLPQLRNDKYKKQKQTANFWNLKNKKNKNKQNGTFFILHARVGDGPRNG